MPSLKSSITNHHHQLANNIAKERIETKKFKSLIEAEADLANLRILDSDRSNFRLQTALDHISYPEESDLLKKACKKCYRRGYSGIHVIYKTNKHGLYERDAEGKPIELHSYRQPCSCILSKVEIPSDGSIKVMIHDYYERNLGVEAKEEPATPHKTPKRKSKGSTPDTSGAVVPNKPTTPRTKKPKSER